MHLILPAASVFKEGHSIEIDMRKELCAKVFPCGISFCRGHFRIFVNDMLEVVNYSSIRNKRKSAKSMHKLIFGCIFSKEFMDIFPCEEFHAHGMSFCGFHAAASDFESKFVIRNKKSVKCMACFMSHYVNIIGRTVKVCKNKRLFIFCNFCAITAAPFVFAGFYIKCLVFEHKINKCGRFIAHFVIHFFCCCKNFFFISRRSGIAAGNDNIVIINHVFINAKIFCVFTAKFCNNRNNGFQNVFAEGFHIFFIIANTFHAIISKFHKVFISKLLCHFCTYFYKSVKNIVKLIRIAIHNGSKDGISFFSGFSVIRFEEAGKSSPAEFFSAEFKFHSCHKFGIFGNDFVFFDHFFDNFGRHGLCLYFHVLKIYRRELFFKFGSEGRRKQSFAVQIHKISDLRSDFIKIIVFFYIKFICGIAAVSDIRKIHGGGISYTKFFIFFAPFKNFISIFCVFNAVYNFQCSFFKFLERNMFIGHFAYFHGFNSFFMMN